MARHSVSSPVTGRIDAGTVRGRRERRREVADTTTEPVEVRVWGAFDAGPDDVLWAHCLLLATPAHFGYMSGLKDFFERIYLRVGNGPSAGLRPHREGRHRRGRAVASVQKIATGMQWHLILPPVTVVGAITAADLERAAELGPPWPPAGRRIY